MALALVGAIEWFKAGLLIISQILGAIAAAGAVSALFPGDLNVRTSLSQGTSITRGLFIEMLLTAELIFCIFMLAVEKHKATFLAPVGIGLALFIAELAGKQLLWPSLCSPLRMRKVYTSLEVPSILLAHSVRTSFSALSIHTTGSTGLVHYLEQ